MHAFNLFPPFSLSLSLLFHFLRGNGPGYSNEAVHQRPAHEFLPSRWDNSFHHWYSTLVADESRGWWSLPKSHVYSRCNYMGSSSPKELSLPLLCWPTSLHFPGTAGAVQGRCFFKSATLLGFIALIKGFLHQVIEFPDHLFAFLFFMHLEFLTCTWKGKRGSRKIQAQPLVLVSFLSKHWKLLNTKFGISAVMINCTASGGFLLAVVSKLLTHKESISFYWLERELLLGALGKCLFLPFFLSLPLSCHPVRASVSKSPPK